MDISGLAKLDAFNQQTTVYIKPHELDKFWAAFTPVYEKTSAAPECLYFEVLEDPAVPGKVTWVVNWNCSIEWLSTVHVAKEYYAPYLAATEPLFTRDREVIFRKREKPFIAAKTANFERLIGEGGEGFSLHVSIELKPECIEDFWTEWKKIYDVVVREPALLYFEVFSDPSAPGKLSWFENWGKSPEWFMKEQISKEYYKPYLAATEPMFAAPREFKILQRRPGFVSWKQENFEGASEVSEVKAS